METDLVDGTEKGALGVDGEKYQRLKGPCEGKGGDSFPDGLVTNGRMNKGHLDIYQSGALGQYCNIWKISANTFKLGTSQIFQMH